MCFKDLKYLDHIETQLKLSGNSVKATVVCKKGCLFLLQVVVFTFSLKIKKQRGLQQISADYHNKMLTRMYNDQCVEFVSQHSHLIEILKWTLAIYFMLC